MRRNRRALSRRQQTRASRQLFRLLRNHPLFIHSKRIAFYLASADEGEIDLAPLLRHARRLGKACYLPVIRRDGQDRLLFARYRPGHSLRRGRFNIPEPPIARARPMPPQALGLVLMPLVGFDAAGNRLGMGKGFYDRSFAFRRKTSRHRPHLVGVAHECQRVEELRAAPWDVPLDAVATPEQLYLF